MEDKQTKCLWVKEDGVGDIIMGVYYRTPDLDREEQPHIHQSLSSWGSSTTTMPARGTIQQGISNPEGVSLAFSP